MQFSYIKIYFIPNGYTLKLNWALSFFCFETGEKISEDMSPVLANEIQKLN